MGCFSLVDVTLVTVLLNFSKAAGVAIVPSEAKKYRSVYFSHIFSTRIKSINHLIRFYQKEKKNMLSKPEMA